jgi:hypothetical protein
MKKKVFLVLSILCLAAFPAFAKELPHYLKGWDRPDDELTKLEKLFSALTVTSEAATPTLTVYNNCEKMTVVVAGKKCTIYFNHYFRENDNTVAYFGTDGMKKLSNHEFDLVKKDIADVLKDAAEKTYFTHRRLTGLAIEAAAKSRGITVDEMKKILEGSTAGVSNADILHIPILTKADFVPRELHFTPIEAWGLTYLSSGIVMYNPQARLVDYLTGEPTIMKHELNHLSSKLQGLPFVWRFDAELMASLATSLHPSVYKLDFLKHSYLTELRKMVKIMYGFDSERAMSEIFTFNMSGSFKINKEALEKHAKSMTAISIELQREIEEKIFPEFYGNMFYWLAVNNIMMDQTAMMKIILARDYDPTILGGRDATASWLDSNDAVIKEIADKAMAKSKEKSDLQIPELGRIITRAKALAGVLGIDEQTAIERLEKKYNLKAEDVLKMNEEQLDKLFNDILEKELSLTPKVR